MSEFNYTLYELARMGIRRELAQFHPQEDGRVLAWFPGPNGNNYQGIAATPEEAFNIAAQKCIDAGGCTLPDGDQQPD